MSYLGYVPAAKPLTSADITDGIITSAKIANGTITTADLASGVGGKVLQVVQATKTDTTSTNSTSFVDLTGLSATITPSSTSSKILMSVSVPFSVGTNRCHFKLLRGSTDILIGDAAGSRLQANYSAYGDSSIGTFYYGNGMFTYSVVDSPSTTSATTYKIQARTNATGTTLYINRSFTDDNSADGVRCASTIILMEIAT